MEIKLVKKIIHWLFAVVTLIFVITGLGITQYRIVEQITFGLLSKALSYQIHTNITIAFLILMILHIYFALNRSKR